MLKKCSLLIGLVPVYAMSFLGVLLLTVLCSRGITVLSEAETPQRRRCIVIDAGHGGVDGGATSCTGVLESEINLQIALRLNDLLNLLGYNTKMIRKTDISVYTEGESIADKKRSDLKQRVKIVNETENGLLISIHQNNFSDSKYNGAQVFYAESTESESFAKNLQKAFVQNLNPGSKRMAKKADGVYLMEHIGCTGVLIECGFLSNREEESLLRSSVYQKKLCCVIASTLSSFASSAA